MQGAQADWSNSSLVVAGIKTWPYATQPASQTADLNIFGPVWLFDVIGLIFTFSLCQILFEWLARIDNFYDSD